MNFYRLLSASALASAALLPHAAFAQTSTLNTGGERVQFASEPSRDCVPNDVRPECRTENPDEVITVTGSRIARPNLDSASPVTSVSAELLTNTADTSLGDALNQLPALRSTFSQANSTRFIGTAGVNYLDLRGLGTERTLVLVNNRRHVTSSPGSYEVDINTIPNALLERVDVLTGGQSAVYGSDAIAGVVNFVLKRDFEGLDARVQAGVTDRGDRGSYIASIVGGKNFNDNRGNIAISAEYARSQPVYFTDRDYQTGAYSGTPTFGTSEYTLDEVGLPNGSDGISDTTFFARPGSRFSNRSIGGTVLTSCPANTAANATRRGLVCSGGRGALAPNPANPAAAFGPGTGAELSDVYLFNGAGVLVRNRFDIDNRPIGGSIYGGQTATGLEGAMLLPGLDRINTNLLFNYEFSPAVQAFVEAKYVHVTANQTSTQPTFNGSLLTNVFFLDNPYLSAENVATLRSILAPGATSFTLNRFNNDIGTRAEDHTRDTYRVVAGLRGSLSTTGNLTYEISGNYGRTDTYYETGGNVDVAKFNAASRAVRNASGQIVCAVNNDTVTTNDMPGCVPLNLFGIGQSSQAALDYVLFTSSRKQWAEQINAVGFISGDTSGLFTLPGGNIGFSLGGEYRREDAFSDYDDFTQSGATFLNSISAFDPKAVEVYEGFGELRVPLLKDQFIHELTIEGAGRYSKYSTADKGVWAYNVGGIFAPVRDVRVRLTYARAVRAPNLGDLYATRSETFANGFVDPCGVSQRGVNPNRARNCAAAGVPTQITYTQDNGQTVTVPWENTAGSGLSGFNQGNLNLSPETSNSFTLGAVFEPRFLPGLALTVDYYDIEVKNVISGLSGQAIIDRCYDDPVGIDNPFCAATFRRTTTNPLTNGTLAGQADRVFQGVATPVNLGRVGPSFLNQPFNYAALKTSGIDVDLSYRRKIGDLTVVARAIVSWLDEREQFIYITAPDQSLRVNGVLGDPEWRGRFNLSAATSAFDVSYDLNWTGSQAITSWEVQHTHQGRGPTNLDAFPFKDYPDQFTHDIQIGLRANDKFRFYFGVDNMLDTLPPYGLTGTGAGSGIYGVQGRTFYGGTRFSF
ncbi:hypothetical protein ASG37_07185 [Sphingomonas sp. Leaf407]|nr:hypothetical protein ASE97_04475 [Sphingomonas sp. Leaf42]KQT28627.1 hypothetical protein ASG37_07185 [Sphingomonas sp. Leaf407]